MINIEALNHNNSVSAYAYEGSTRSIQQGKKTIVALELSVTFDNEEALLQEEVRLATGEDINWWACVSDEIPRDKYVICQDGVYIWKEIREWDGYEDFDVVDMKFVKINK